MQINIQLDKYNRCKNKLINENNIELFSNYYLRGNNRKNEKFIYFSSLIGLRDMNEDTHNIIVTNNINMYGIYDGHGGDFTSKFLSKYLPIYILNNIKKSPLRKKQIISIFDHIQKMLKKKHRENATKTGSTCLICLQYKFDNFDKIISIINLGDSRGIICRNNSAFPLSKDHKPSWPEEKNRIENLNGKIYFDGFDWRIHDLSVSRAFGDLYAYPHVCQTPDVFNYKISSDDKFIVLACDGLWDILSNQDVINYILFLCYNDDLSIRINKNLNITKKLAEYAIKKGSTDNVSIIIIFLD